MRCRFAAIPSLWALAFGAAVAQENPSADAKKSSDEEKVERNWPKFELGWGSWGLDGNERTFRRYGTPDRGLTLREFSFTNRELSPASYQEFLYRGSPLADSIFQMSGLYGPRLGYFEVGASKTDFFEATPYRIDNSRRMDAYFAVRQPLGPGFQVTADGKHDQLDKTTEGPDYSKHTRTNTFNSQVTGLVGAGKLDVGFAQRRFYDRANFQPDSLSQTWRGALLYPVGPFDVQGSFAQTRIEQDGLRTSKVKTYNLDAGLPLNQDFEVQFGFRGQKYDLPEVINAYVRERNTSWGRVIGRIGDVNAEVAYKHVETERVRADHRFVDVPKWDRVDARLSGKALGDIRWSLKGTIEGLDGNAVMLTEDPNRLYWDDKSNVQANLSYGSDLWSGYFTYNHRFLQNSPRRLEIRSNQYVVGGTIQVRQNVEAFGEFTHDSASTDFREIDANIGLESFFPSSRVTTVGVNWVIDDNTSLSSTYSHLTTDNDNPIFERDGNIKSRFFTAHLRHTDAKGNEFGLLISPGKYEDKVIRQLGYETRVVMLTARIRF